MKQFVGRVFSQYAMRPFRGDFFHYAEMVGRRLPNRVSKLLIKE